MGDGALAGLGLAFWFGLLTAVSPCPLTTNIAAMSFLARRLGSTSHVVLSGLLYTAGRVAAYVLLGGLVVYGLVSVPSLSVFLQERANKLLAPILIITGMFLLDLLSLDLELSVSSGTALQEEAGRGGLHWAFIMGFVFALSFCPVSAALFFGSIVPLAMKYGSSIALPLVYGVGTGLPVFAFALLIAAGAGSLSRVFDRVRTFEAWARRATGFVFIMAGIYLSLVYVYKVL